MSNNLFLTGRIHIGKSTLINKIIHSISGQVCGFRTLRYYKGKELKGFYIEGFNKNERVKEDLLIGKCLDDNSWIGIPSTFDQYGVEILKDCLNRKPDCIVMDELGFFENEAFKFQKIVIHLLNSSIPVLGVIKEADTPFLNVIRSRQDSLIFTITEENRDEIQDMLIHKIQSFQLDKNSNHGFY